MKNILSVALPLLLILCNWTGLDAQEKKFEVSGSSYYSTGMFGPRTIGEVSFGYSVAPAVSLSLSGLCTNLYSSDKAWGTSLSVSASPKICENFFLIPSVGAGVLGGMLNGKHYNVRACASLSVEARYMLYDGLFCGFESRYLSAGPGLDTFLFGLKLGIRL